jgi:hypothetical protein
MCLKDEVEQNPPSPKELTEMEPEEALLREEQILFTN